MHGDAPPPCGDSGGYSLPAYNLSIHDNVILDINTSWGTTGADGRLYQLLSGDVGTCNFPGPHDITINHNTGFTNDVFVDTGGYKPPATIGNFVFENNIVPHAVYGFNGDGVVGEGTPVLVAYYTSPYVFLNNAIEAGSSGNYPANNFFPVNWAAVSLVDSTNCNAGTFTPADCALQSGSPYHLAGTDGKDLGADITTLLAKINGVM